MVFGLARLYFLKNSPAHPERFGYNPMFHPPSAYTPVVIFIFVPGVPPPAKNSQTQPHGTLIQTCSSTTGPTPVCHSSTFVLQLCIGGGGRAPQKCGSNGAGGGGLGLGALPGSLWAHMRRFGGVLTQFTTIYAPPHE